jgi:hypothetical protein
MTAAETMLLPSLKVTAFSSILLILTLQRIAVSLAHSCVGDEYFSRRPHIKDAGHRRAKHAKQSG